MSRLAFAEILTSLRGLRDFEGASNERYQCYSLSEWGGLHGRKSGCCDRLSFISMGFQSLPWPRLQKLLGTRLKVEMDVKMFKVHMVDCRIDTLHKSCALFTTFQPP